MKSVFIEVAEGGFICQVREDENTVKTKVFTTASSLMKEVEEVIADGVLEKAKEVAAPSTKDEVVPTKKARVAKEKPAPIPKEESVVDLEEDDDLDFDNLGEEPTNAPTFEDFHAAIQASLRAAAKKYGADNEALDGHRKKIKALFGGKKKEDVAESDYPSIIAQLERLV